MVIGPTPPGTGVIAPRTSAASAKATSPTRRLLPSGPATRWMPTSMTMAPGLIQLPLHHLRPADRGDHEVGAADHGGQVARARVGDRDRAVLGEQQLRHRLADDVGAADDDRLEPRQLGPHRLGEDHAARGVHGASALRAGASRPTLTG